VFIRVAKVCERTILDSIVSNNSEKPKKKVANPYGRNGKKARHFHTAMDMYNKDYTLKVISAECGVNISTLRRWLRDAGIPPKKNGSVPNPKPYLKEGEAKPESIFDGFEAFKVPSVVEEAHVAAKAAETKRIADLAVNQTTPAEQYQSYMASNAVRLMRDGIQTMKPPSNVREMEVLDKIARRHFGLDDNRGGGVGSLSIDINILNDAAATKRATINKEKDLKNKKDKAAAAEVIDIQAHVQE
tara:strand:+ start:3761 stop:4492 length:732 start_codon:yes stop_codon:yes gene_type:complete